MKIRWKKVTWYSRYSALALFVILPFAGFYCGAQYGLLQGYINGVDQVLWGGKVLTLTAGNGYYGNVAAWVVDRGNGFTMAYPLDFDAQNNDTGALSADWRLGANGAAGIKMLTVTVPRAFEPQTNFGGATVIVGRSGSKSAVAQCLIADPNAGIASTSTESINGIRFFVSNSTGVGAGNYYETTSYRTVRAGQCYAVEYTIHSTQIMNYPALYGLRAFDKMKIQSVLQKIVGTFRFE